MRERTHWCVEKKHKKCGGVVYILQQYRLLGFLKELIGDFNFYLYKCLCFCHRDISGKLREKYKNNKINGLK